MKNAKYLMTYSIPFVCIWSLLSGGYMAYATVIYAFGILPIADQLFPQHTINLSYEEKKDAIQNHFFDLILYINLPLTYGVLALLIYQLNNRIVTSNELIGHTLSVGIVLATCGINVAHELGHRANPLAQIGAKLLLVPCLYTHFTIEHNRGHHLNVATPIDPATARKGENLYAFWVRSAIGTYRNAWRLETKRLRRRRLSFWNIRNEMIINTITVLAYLVIIFYTTQQWTSCIAVITTGILSILFLESINYIEHYGLVRKQLANGRYERVKSWHSWNANYALGRTVLYELTRHSDHHFLSYKKYQALDHHDQAPVLPFGYPASILLALIPPLWFRIMHPRLEQLHQLLQTTI